MSTPLLFAAVAVFVVGGVAWVFPRATAGLAGEWFLPGLSIAGLVLAIGLAAQWPLLRGLLVVLGIVLVLAWNRASMTSTSHFAGAALGCLLMAGLGRWAITRGRLRLSMLAFLCGGLAVFLLGLAGASVRAGTLLDTAAPAKPPPLRLGLAGLPVEGDVNTNALASAVLLVLPLGVAVLVIGTRHKADWWTLLPAAVAVVAAGSVTLVISHSRTALIAVWLMALGLLVGGLRHWFHRLIAGMLVLAPVLLLTGRLPFLTQEVALRDANNGWVSAQGRAQIARQALDRLKQSPWLGVGLNEFRHLYAPRPGDLPQEKDIAHVHNMVLQTALDIGLVGSAAYWSILVYLWVRAGQAAGGMSRTARTAAAGAAFSLIAVNLFGLTDAVPLGSKIGTLQWAAGGLILAAWHLRRDSADAPDINDAGPRFSARVASAT